MKPIRRLLALAVALGLLTAACGDDDGAPSSAPERTAATRDVPGRIISLSPSSTEMLFAIGAGDQVVAVDDHSNHPPEAPKTDLSAYTPNVEAIASYEPDLVVFDGTGDLEASLERLDIDVLVQPAAKTLDDTYSQIEELGERTGHEREAADLVKDMKRRIDAVARSVPADARTLTYYHELDPTLFTVTSKTFIGNVYALLRLQSVADPADTAGSGYPQLSNEFIVDADPDLVFLADTKCCGQSASALASRPGWAGLKAVTTGAVVELDDDIASRWGPRIVDFLETVAPKVAELRRAG